MLVYPVFFGSAITGAGAGPLSAGLTELLPAAQGDAGGPAAGAVFKVERGPAGEKIAYVRLFSGTLHTRDRVRFGQDHTGKVTAISVFGGGAAGPRGSVAAGQIAKVWGLGEIQTGDLIGQPGTAAGRRYFAPPTLETVVVPGHPADRGALHAALTQLAEQDPLINLRQDDLRQEMYLSLYGEVQKEVIQATLANDFGIGVTFRGTATICIERLAGPGVAVEMMGEAANPFLATVGLRVEPAPVGTGVRFGLGIEAGALPVPFRKAVEETVRRTLARGHLRLGDPRLCRHPHALRLRPAAGQARAVVRPQHFQHRRRFPRPDPAGPDQCAAAGRYPGVRAGPAVHPGGPGRYRGPGQARAWAAGRGPAHPAAAGPVLPAGG